LTPSPSPSQPSPGWGMGAAGFLVLALLAIAGLWAGWERLAPPTPITTPREETPTTDTPAGEAGEAPVAQVPGEEVPTAPADGRAWRLPMPDAGSSARLMEWARVGERLEELAAAAIP